MKPNVYRAIVGFTALCTTYRAAGCMDAVDGKNVLGEIDADGDNAHGFPLLSFVRALGDQSWTKMKSPKYPGGKLFPAF